MQKHGRKIQNSGAKNKHFFQHTLIINILHIKLIYIACQMPRPSFFASDKNTYLWITPKILPLGKTQVYLLSPSLIRIFG